MRTVLNNHVCVYHGVLTPKRALMDARHMSHIAACDCAQLGKLMDLVSTCLLPMPLGNNHVGPPEATWPHCAHVSSPRRFSFFLTSSARQEVLPKCRSMASCVTNNLPTAIHDDLPLWAWLVLQWDTRPRGVPSNHCAHAHSKWPTAQATTAWTTWRISSRLPLAPELATDFFRPNHSLYFTACT